MLALDAVAVGAVEGGNRDLATACFVKKERVRNDLQACEILGIVLTQQPRTTGG